MRGIGLAFVFLFAPTAAAAADLVVRLEGVAPSGGTLRVGVFASAEAFAARRDGVLASRHVPARGERAEVRFADLPAGRYAVSAHHDVDDDRELDRLLGVVPKEGVALSNNPTLRRPPSFDDIAVALDGDGIVTLRLVYPLGVQAAAAE